MCPLAPIPPSKQPKALGLRAPPRSRRPQRLRRAQPGGLGRWIEAGQSADREPGRRRGDQDVERDYERLVPGGRIDVGRAGAESRPGKPADRGTQRGLGQKLDGDVRAGRAEGAAQADLAAALSTSVAPSAASSCSSVSTCSPESESRLPVGSSASRIAGRLTTARAIATRWRSPPESVRGRNSMRWPSPTRVSATRASARWRRSGAPV